MSVFPHRLRVLHLLLAVVMFASCGNSEEDAARDPNVLYVGTAEAEDGVPIAYQRKGGGYPSIVLVHGWACDRTYWRKQFDALATRYTVVAIDLAGHGASGNHRKAFSMEAFGADVNAVVKKEDLRAIILTGHSMGGAVVLEAARRMPDRVMGIIGVDTYHDILADGNTAEVDSFITAMRSDFKAATQPWIRSMFTAHANASLVEEIVSDMSSADPAVAVDAFRHYARYNHLPGFREIGVPLYCLNADRWPTNLLPLRQLLPSAAMTSMPGNGHFVMLESPDTFLTNFTTAVNYIKAHVRRN